MDSDARIREILRGYNSSIIDLLLNSEEFKREAERILFSEGLSEREKVKRVRKTAYYFLRRYRFNEVEVSFLERGEEGVSAIIMYIERLLREHKCDAVLDVGSGLFPLTLGRWSVKPAYYYALDKDEGVIDRLREYSRTTTQTLLVPIKIDLSDLPKYRQVISQMERKPCLTIYSRVLHLLWRLHRIDPLEYIRTSPSKVQMILEPKTSLVRSEDISGRERRFLRGVAERCLKVGLCYRRELLDFPNDIGVALYLG